MKNVRIGKHFNNKKNIVQSIIEDKPFIITDYEEKKIITKVKKNNKKEPN